MSPRSAAFVRLVLVAFVVLSMPFAADAQTCTAPTIHQSAGQLNPTCMGEPFTLDAGEGWTTYVWSNGATGRSMSDAVTTSTTYTVTVTDAYGCTVTSEPYTMTVEGGSMNPPVITAPASVCANTQQTASAAYPPDGGPWQTIIWEISGGYFYDPVGTQPTTGSGTTIPFVATGEVTLTATAIDYGGCRTPVATAQVATGAVEPPVIHAPPDVCAYGSGTVSVSPPSNGGQWADLTWEILGGGYFYDGSQQSTVTSIPSPIFYADGSGSPISFRVQVTDVAMCEAEAATSVSIRTIEPPVIHAPPDVCAYGSGTVSVSPPPNGEQWADVAWEILGGGYFYDGSQQSTATSVPSPIFYGDGSGSPISFRVHVTDHQLCEAEATTNVSIRTIEPPVIHAPPDVCAHGSGTVSVSPPPNGDQWADVSWEILGGGYFYDGSQQSTATSHPSPIFYADGSGSPISFRVHVTDHQMCEAEATTNVSIRTIEPPVIHAPSDVCASGSGTVSVSPPPDGDQWADVTWEILGGGYFYDGSEQSTATSHPSPIFYADGSGSPISFRVHVTDHQMCEAAATTTVSIRTIEPPVIHAPPDVCANGSGTVSVSPPSDGEQWADVTWEILGGGYFYDGSQQSTATSIPSPIFYADGSGSVISFRVNVTDWSMCEAEATTTVSIRTIAPPVITAPASVCTNGSGTLSVAPPAEGGTWSNVDWYIQSGGYVIDPVNGQGSSTSGESITFYADGSGSPIVALAYGRTTGECQSVAQVEIAVGTATATITGPASFCGNTTARLEGPAGMSSYSWSNGATTPYIDVTEGGTYSVTAVNASGCTATSAPFTIAELAPPDATITSRNPVICDANNGVMLEAPAGMDSYSWSTGGTLDYIVVSQPGNYSVTVTKNGCSTTSSPYTVTTGTRPAEYPELTTWGQRLCPGATSTASITNAAAFSRVKWVVYEGDVTIIGPDDQASVTFQVGVAGPARIGVQGFSASGCFNGNSVSLEVEPPSTEFTLGPAMCAGTNYALSITEPDVATYDWSITNGTIVSGNGSANVVYRANAAGPVSITVTATRDGCSTTTTHTTTAEELPQPVMTAPAMTCTRTGLTASVADHGPNAIYYWGSDDIVVNGSNRGSSISFNIKPGVTNARVTVMVEVGTCRKFTDHYIAVDTATAVVSGNAAICAGGSATITAALTGTAPWSITWSDGVTQNGITTSTVTRSVSPSAATTYTITAISDASCSGTSSGSATISVNPNPPTGITAVQVLDAPGSGAISRSGDVITACGNPTVRLIPTLHQSYTYAWSTGHQGATLDVTTSGVYTVTVTTPSGCTSSSTVTVNFTPIPAAPVLTAPVTELCPAGGSITLTAPAADGWLWSNGATTQSIVVTETGSYSVRVRAGTCESQPSNAVVITSGTSSITADSLMLCGPDGEVTLTANEGTAWLWSNGATTRSITVGDAGTFTVTTSNNGCTMAESQPVTVEQRSVSIQTGGSTSVCEGASVMLVADGGTSWSWSNGATTKAIYVTEPGPYTVTASFGNGCALTSAPVVVEVHDLQVEVTADRAAICAGGSITFTSSVTGGTSYSYQWFDQSHQPIGGATSPTLTFSPAGSGYVYLQVTDEIGCQKSDGIGFTVESPIDATIAAPDAICAGTSGSASVADAGADATYAWSISGGTLDAPSSRSVTFTPSGSGPVTLTVTVTNPGCSATSSRTINVTALPSSTITADGPLTFCAGGSVTLTAPAGPGNTYSWSNGATSPSITVNAAGTYTVTVTNGACSSSSSATVTVNPVPESTITANGPLTFCAGGNVTLTAPAGAGNTYAWSNGATTRAITVSDANTYTVTVTNGACSSSSSTTVTVNPVPESTITANGPLTFCAGGSVTLTAPAGTGNTYSWSNGATTRSITVNDANTYTVTVSNGACSSSSSATVTVNPVPESTITANGPLTFCAGGSVTLTAPAGAGNTYAWSNGATTRSITVSDANTYTVTVSNGACSSSSSATVTVNPVPESTITADGPLTFCAGGNVTLTAPAGAGNTYAWSNGATTRSITVSNANTYTVTVSNGACSSSSSATVVVNPVPESTITANGPLTFCAGGSVTLTAPAGAGNTYAWSNGATSRSITVSDANTYTVTVSNGACSSSSNATVTVNPVPESTITANGPLTFCAGGSVTLTAPAGAGNTYAWSNGATTRSITVSDANSYTVTVSNGACSSSSSATVTVSPVPASTITADGPLTFCAGGSVTLTAPAGAGNTYSWSNGATSPSITVNAAGTYTVTVTNGACSSSSSATVTVNPVPESTITANGPLTFCAGGSVTLTAPAGTGNTYAWSNGATSRSITVSDANTYTVTVSNGACSSSSSATVTVNPVPESTITASGPLTFCAGGNVTLTAPAGAGNTYAWSNGATTRSITVSNANTYTVTVTNGACSSSSSATVTVNPVPPSTITADGPLTFCAGPQRTLTAPAGYSYVWSNGATSQSIQVSSSNTYWVDISSASCTVRASTTVTVNPLPPADITVEGSLALCPGSSVTLRAPAGYSYLWSNGATAQSITVAHAQAGSFYVDVTQGSCTRRSSIVTVTALAAVAITTQPADVTMPRNVTRELTVGATGAATLTYRWEKRNTDGTWSMVQSSTDPRHVIGAFTRKGQHFYRVIVSSSTCSGTATSRIVTVNVT